MTEYPVFRIYLNGGVYKTFQTRKQAEEHIKNNPVLNDIWNVTIGEIIGRSQ